MKTQALVERALKEHPITRSSDRHLIAAVWSYQNPQWHYIGAKWLLTKAANPETITRHRREFQKAGLYPATEEVNEQRYKKFEQVKAGDLSVL